MRGSSSAQRLEAIQARDHEAAAWPRERNPIAQWSRLPIPETELSEADIRYSVRFKSRRTKPAKSARPRPQNDHTTGTRAAGKKTARPADKFFMAYALIIGILAGLAIPSFVVLIAVLIVNPSAIGTIFSQLLLAVMATG